MILSLMLCSIHLSLHNNTSVVWIKWLGKGKRLEEEL